MVALELYKVFIVTFASAMLIFKICDTVEDGIKNKNRVKGKVRNDCGRNE